MTDRPQKSLSNPAAVTLEGTVIHKSGSITGGQSAQGAGRKWDEKEITST